MKNACQKICKIFDVLIFNLYLETEGIMSSISLLYLIKTSWCRWIIYFKEKLILICPFCFNMRLKNCLLVQERSSILLVALEILKSSSRYISSKMASLQCQSQSQIILLSNIEYGICAIFNVNVNI